MIYIISRPNTYSGTFKNTASSSCLISFIHSNELSWTVSSLSKVQHYSTLHIHVSALDTTWCSLNKINTIGMPLNSLCHKGKCISLNIMKKTIWEKNINTNQPYILRLGQTKDSQFANTSLIICVKQGIFQSDLQEMSWYDMSVIIYYLIQKNMYIQMFFIETYALLMMTTLRWQRWKYVNVHVKLKQL